MLAKAKAKYIRMSARKARLVTDLVKGKTVEEANFIFESAGKRACGPIKKVVASAFANLNQNRQEKILAKDVVISAISADDGPMFRRYRAATMGRATPIRHRTSHVYVELDSAVQEKTVKTNKESK
ncbi:MAG: 50S ribosomal protein L22 [Candidatus Omnitrophica bacterium]|nr:50S ribosomal protein L22 [Candidatus Omnitrophota bacterium]